MRDESSGNLIQCPYCGLADCSHLLAMIDVSFNDWWEAGYAGEDERYYEFHRVIEDAFRQLLRKGVRECPMTHPKLAELWKYALLDYSPGPKVPLKGEDEEISLYPSLLNTLIIELFENAGAAAQDGIDDHGAPGFSSAMTILHAENPQAVFDAALLQLRQLLTLVPT